MPVSLKKGKLLLFSFILYFNSNYRYIPNAKQVTRTRVPPRYSSLSFWPNRTCKCSFWVFLWPNQPPFHPTPATQYEKRVQSDTFFLLNCLCFQRNEAATASLSPFFVSFQCSEGPLPPRRHVLFVFNATRGLLPPCLSFFTKYGAFVI